MSHALHAYLLTNDNKHNEDWAFESIQSLFADSKGVAFTKDRNPFTNQNILKLTIDGVYTASVFFEKSEQVLEDFKSIKEDKESQSRIRVLFAPDPDNEFDDIAVMIYDFLTELDDVVVYSPNQEKILYETPVI